MIIKTMKPLLTITAVLEALAGMGLIAAPSFIVKLLVGSPLNGAEAMTLTRIAGAALVSLAMVCWFSRNNATALGVVKAMLFYNIAGATVFLHGAIGYKLSGVGLWPAVLLHAGLALWCIVTLVHRKEIVKSI